MPNTPFPYAPGLPILEKREELLELIRSHSVIVVAGETGSGKSTQLPLLCREAVSEARVAVTQPRRIAATSLARRVSEQLQSPLGDQVGYRIRFDERSTAETPIVFMTDGIILRETQSDPRLEKYDVIIVDEAHERSLNIDFLLGYLRRILSSRPELRVVISSATIDTELFSKAFGDAPVVEVSGRIFPVETIYLPADQENDEQDSFVDAAVDATLQLAEDPEPGGILVFMPTERDIQETVAKLRGAAGDHCSIFPLYSRLSALDQNRIFGPSDKRKIVVATNIAETSITVPDIRSVVDTGLARMHRYIPSLHTSRLPVEEISQAAANQRKGRCGRVADGLCVRLYSEEDFLEREEFTTPEIQRSNLAGVILSMHALGLGDVSRFPFLQPPSPQAIRDGFRQLKYLGALDDDGTITGLGRKMARLPLDPHVSRMVLAASKEGVLEEVTVIAAGISVVDPRRQPEDKQELARMRHREFSDPRSDFQTLHNLWRTYHDTWDSLRTQSAMRRYCRDNFLSYQRMQEWHDIYRQIGKSARLRPKKAEGFDDAQRFERIHRAILSGLIINACLKNDDNSYRATRGRTVFIHPGSVLFKARPEWIMCHEVVETSRAFARTVAAIKPSWIERLAPHLCKSTYHSPAFDPQTGFVSAYENVTFFGLPLVENRRVNYGKINASEAMEMFIREGLVEEQLRSHHAFYRHNKRLRKEALAAESKLRRRGIAADDEHLVELYKSRLDTVTSVHELNRLIRSRKSDRFLRFEKDDFLAESLPAHATDFPKHLRIGPADFRLEYSFAPGEQHDGVTVEIPQEAAGYVDPQALGWLVQPLWEEKIRYLLQSLPKSIRKNFIPVRRHAHRLATELSCQPVAFTDALRDKIKELYRISIPAEEFSEDSLPAHLRMRIKLLRSDNTVVRESRDAQIILKGDMKSRKDETWHAQFIDHERRKITSWDCEEIPEEIVIAGQAGKMPFVGYPAYTAGTDMVDLVVYPRKEDAENAHRKGVEKLLELSLAADFIWEEKDLKLTKSHKLFLSPFCESSHVRQNLVRVIHDHAFRLGVSAPPRKRQSFEKLLECRRTELRGRGSDAASILDQIVSLYDNCRTLIDVRSSRQKGTLFRGIGTELTKDLKAYGRRLCTETLTWTYFSQMPRYLKAFHARVEKAFVDSAGYRSRMAELREQCSRLEKIAAHGQNTRTVLRINHLEEMIEEYAISLFAPQTVRTRFPISPKRLDKAFAKADD